MKQIQDRLFRLNVRNIGKKVSSSISTRFSIVEDYHSILFKELRFEGYFESKGISVWRGVSKNYVLKGIYNYCST